MEAGRDERGSEREGTGWTLGVSRGGSCRSVLMVTGVPEDDWKVTGAPVEDWMVKEEVC